LSKIDKFSLEATAMTTIQQIAYISDNHRLTLDFDVPDDIPVGEASIEVVISPIPRGKPFESVMHLAGVFANSTTFAGDPVEIQRALRDEW
jgi:hypothetical protein